MALLALKLSYIVGAVELSFIMSMTFHNIMNRFFKTVCIVYMHAHVYVWGGGRKRKKGPV